jgi:hypothetical protein
MLCPDIGIEVPESLVVGFASDPESPYEKVLTKLNDPGWPLHKELRKFVDRLPMEAVKAARADKIFAGIYGTDERLARAWFAQWLLMQKASEGFVAHGVPVDSKDRAYWRTALHGAASKGDINIIRFLASSGANINAVDRSGDSPLELAIANDQEAAASVLAALGAKRIQGDQAQRDKAIRDQVQEDIDSLQRR